MRAFWDIACDIFGANLDGCKRGQGAVDGGDNNHPVRCQHIGNSADKGLACGDMLYHLRAIDEVIFSLILKAFFGQFFREAIAVIDGKALRRAMCFGRLNRRARGIDGGDICAKPCKGFCQ